MTEADQKKILKECQTSSKDKIFITHGTDTMTEIAKLLGQFIKDKTIVLTDAIVPTLLVAPMDCII